MQGVVETPELEEQSYYYSEACKEAEGVGSLNPAGESCDLGLSECSRLSKKGIGGLFIPTSLSIFPPISQGSLWLNSVESLESFDIALNLGQRERWQGRQRGSGGTKERHLMHSL